MSGDRKGVERNTDRWHGLFTGDEEKPKRMGPRVVCLKKRTKTQAREGQNEMESERGGILGRGWG